MKYWDGLFTLEGETVNLIPISMDHLEGLWEAGKPEEIWDFMATKVRSQEEMAAMITQAIEKRENGSQYTFSVLDHKDRIIGSTRFLDISTVNKSVEIGWTWYHPDVWRTKVNTECKLLLLSHCFEKWEITRVQFKTDLRNLRSQQAISRLGAMKEGTLRKDRVISGGFARDTVYFSILDSEWLEVKKELNKKLEMK